MSDSIIVDIDDSALEDLLIKLELVKIEGRDVTGSSEPLATTLPGIDRNMRVILSRIPGMREAISYYFRLRYIERGIEKIPVEGFTFLGLTLLATAIILFQKAMQFQEDLMRDRGEYEALLRQNLSITHEEYMAMDIERRGYATEWDEFVAAAQENILVAVLSEVGLFVERLLGLKPGYFVPGGGGIPGGSEVQ